jgi:NarL family two-component system response regulator LiaR
MDRINVAIVEDDLDWLKAITCFLGSNEDINIVWTADNKEKALDLAKKQFADVILMDINLSGNKFDGIYAAAEISRTEKSKIIMLTSLNGENIISDSFIAGAVNFISKTDYRKLPGVIRSAFYNSSPFEIVLKDYLRLKEEEQLKDLTNAEKEIINLMRKGYTQSQIENELYKSERTLKNQVNKMLKKMEVKNSREAVKKINFRGLFGKKTDL